jgi:pimeloyl-ACP methyl ester carboxylesterase
MKLVLLLAGILLLQSSYAQHLKRKGSLGVGFYQRLTDSLKNELQYTEGAVIQFTAPGTTAEKLGIQPYDIVKKVNGQAVAQPSQLLPLAKKLRSGDSINVEIIRKKQRQNLHGIVLERPRETSTTADVIYGEFAYKTGHVRTIYKTLKGKKPVATIYFLQGLPCYSMDNFQELDKTKQALDAMVDRGFAVYRMEKGDMGDNSGLPPCETMGYHDELAMYKAGYDNLLKLEGLDKENIFLFGHSMGGTTAPLLAEIYQPKGVVVYGTLFKPWMEYLYDAYLVQPQYYGEDLADLREQLEQHKPYVNDFFYGRKTPEEIVSTPGGLRAFQEILSYNPATKQAASGRSLNTFKELNECNTTRGWGNYTNHVLAIYGECDIAANNAEDHKALINYVNKKHPGKGSFWLAEGTTHTFEKIGSMEAFIKWQSNPQAYQQYAATRFNPEVFDYACNWMKKIKEMPAGAYSKPLYQDMSSQLPDDGAKTAAMDVVAVDIDNDKDLDIILANEFEANTLLINDGKGNFTNESTKRLPQEIHDSEDIAVADFNGDGLPDIVFCSEDDKVHEYYWNTGNGYFKAAPYTLPASEANCVKAFDCNKDGKPDLIFGNNGLSVILINKGNGDFEKNEKRLPAISRITQDIAIADIDNDKDPDIILANENGNLVYINNGKGYFTDATDAYLPQGVAMESRKIAVADADKDGDPDLFFANVTFQQQKPAQNRLYLNNGKGKFTDVTATQLPADNDNTIDAIFEDVDDNGTMDIVLGNVFGGAVKIYTNDGKANFTENTQAILGKLHYRDALGLIAADLNGDGTKELYVCDRYNRNSDRKDLLLVKQKK